MTGERSGASRVGLPVAELDVLDLVRTGALPSYPPDAVPGSISLPLPPLADGLTAFDEVELTDLEGVPVARVPVVEESGRLLASGVPAWLSARSERPFESWHQGPAGVVDRTGLVVLRGPTGPDQVAAALQRVGPRPLLLLLVCLDGDADPAALQTAYLTRALLSSHPEAEAAVAPTPATLTTAERDAVVRRYAQGRPVTVLDPDPAADLRADAGTVLFFTGLSGAGKSTLARAVRNRLLEDGLQVTLLDGDVVRRHLSAGLGFSAADRATNVRRIGWVAAEVAHHGGIAICSPIAPYEQDRQQVRQMVQSRGGRFVLVHVATPLAECERRDRKGLYARARRGEVADFTGISAPYEEPAAPDLRLDTTGGDVDALVDDVLAVLDAGVRC